MTELGASAWWSYDQLAETYDRLAVPNLFAQPARDLVALLRLPPGARALDVGAGTGVAALLALESAGPGAVVVALDPSPGMLRLARRRGLSWLVRGATPGLPFPDACFDGLLANFVLSHIPSCQTALLDAARVLRPGSRLGFTAWGPGQSEPRKRWQAATKSFVGKERLSRGSRQAIPWEERFSDPAHLEEALRDAGLAGVEVHHREYKNTMSIEDFLAMREVTVQARLLRELLDAAQGESFRENLASEFHRLFHGLVEDIRDAYPAVGAKARA